jgi:hypothetical protein
MSADAEALHSIRWTFDRGSVTSEAICHAPAGADCRLVSVTCECEQWGAIDRRDDGTIWHKIVDYGDSIEPLWHQVEPQDDCNVCLFINESGCVDELGAGTFTIAEVPIKPVWLDEGCDWEPLHTDWLAAHDAHIRTQAAHDALTAAADTISTLGAGTGTAHYTHGYEAGVGDAETAVREMGK